MKTPTGIECPFFYGDYYRGRNFEECRLLNTHTAQGKWSVELCETCPVPGIKRANACPTMNLTAVIKKGFLGIKKRVKVSAFCTRSQTAVKVPEVGCGICHPLTDLFGEEVK